MKVKKLTKNQRRQARHRRTRKKIAGTAQVPRLSVFKSNQHIYCSLVNDDTGEVFMSFSDSDVVKSKKSARGNIENARKVGEKLAAEAVKKGYKRALFDKGGYKYHGKVKAVADGARSKGLKL